MTSVDEPSRRDLTAADTEPCDPPCPPCGNAADCWADVR